MQHFIILSSVTEYIHLLPLNQLPYQRPCQSLHNPYARLPRQSQSMQKTVAQFSPGTMCPKQIATKTVDQIVLPIAMVFSDSQRSHWRP